MKKVLNIFAVLASIISAFSLQAQDLEDVLSQMASSNIKAVYDQEYTFNTYLQMEISDPGANSVVYNIYTTKDGKSYAVRFNSQGAESVILLDTQNSSLLMLADDGGEKTGMAIGIDPKALAELTAKIESTEKDYSEFKTGKTRILLDYQCDEYLIREDGTEISMWVSEELGKKIGKKALASQGIFGGGFAHAAGVRGMVMEYSYKDIGSDESRGMKVTRIDLEARNSVKVSDYAVMSMGQ